VNPVVVVLATKRLTQLIVEDELTRPVREAIDHWAKGAAEFSFRDRVATLAMCPACMSVWAGGAILLAGRHPVGRALSGVLAASGAALLLEAIVGRLER
jgi:Protein of unknown function (DUF1360)